MKIVYDAEVDAMSITFSDTTVTTHDLGDGVVAELDANPAMKQTVHVIRLQNIDPQTALPVLQDIFQKSGTSSSRTSSSSQTSPLQSRINQQSQQTTSGTTRTDTSGSGGAGGMGGFGQ